MTTLSNEEKAYIYIREAIVNNHLQNGQYIRQETLARELGMSRTPIRGALSQLAGEGLIVLKKNAGAIVKK
ncbi:GntR family transcriptional regulator [Bacillus cereus]|uniref:HTH gntR-type domain-containing protein n=1 Tax=Bacillus cereus VD184 TaxID=1053242 RepID=A0A9W5R600_BACCE|nr:GntR family transcriptional regulator [Bacillus cereus]EOQ11106.1 hypothetical protein IKC_05705 [Bacillus cereus VD184]